ncbi:MAG TPA: DUF4124 domain-containing protein [Steroidobacteraceae bacterium]|nr:DUF4124 domain-containing protein [Steroidobacteraceae bacterium]
MLLVCSLALAGTVYRWVDENGVVHYSDTPHPDAEKVHVDSVQTYKAPAAPAAAATTPGPSAPASVPVAYQSCAIAAPVDDSTLMNPDSLTVVVHTEPALHSGDQVAIQMDGQPIPGLPTTGTTFTISPVDRGTHTVTAVVRSSQGTLVCQSSGVTFHVQQPSVLSPINRPTPAPH